MISAIRNYSAFHHRTRMLWEIRSCIRRYLSYRPLIAYLVFLDCTSFMKFWPRVRHPSRILLAVFITLILKDYNTDDLHLYNLCII